MKPLEKLKKLQAEIKKYSNFKISEDEKKVIQESIFYKFDSNDNSFFQITTKSSLPSAFSIIMNKNKITKLTFPIINSMIDCLDCCDSSSLIIILKTFEGILPQIDYDLSLKILQVIPTFLLNNVETLEIISSIFSISVSLINDTNMQVSTTAFASTQQMISLLFQYATKMKVDQNSYRTIEKQQFPNSAYAASYLLLRDFSELINNRTTIFIRVSSVSAISDLWNTILISNNEFISKCSFLLDAVKATINLPLTQNNIGYLSTIFKFFTDKFLDISTSFIEQLTSSNTDHLKIVFLRDIFIRKSELTILFDNDVILRIIKMLDKICVTNTSNKSNSPNKNAVKDHIINISLQPLQLQEALMIKDKESFDKAFSIEFALFLVSSYGLNHKTINLAQKLNLMWEGIATLLLKGIRLCDTLHINIVFKSYNIFLSLCSKNGISECSAILLRILCSFVAKQKLVRNNIHPIEILANSLLHENNEGLDFKKKRAVAYQMLVSLLYNNPLFFSKFYPRLFLSFGMYPRASQTLEANFTEKMDITELKKLCQVLCKGTPFCVSFLKKIILINKERFSQIWESISIYIPDLFKDNDMVEATLDLLSEVTMQCFDESILIVFASSIETIGVKKRIIILNLVRTILGQNSGKIEKNWGYILETILPNHCGNDSELIGVAFASLSIICNDHFQKLSEKDMQACISALFEFAQQRVNINISLSSLGLLWVITPLIHQISRFWKRILSETLVFFNDPRSDVATCSLKTFFSLLSSNTGQIPLDIYDHLIVSCFIPLLMAFTSFRPESWHNQQIALLEICHCACSFWSKFESNPQFLNNFWTLLIEKQQNFMMNCENQEINSAALQFYEEAFNCPNILMVNENDLTDGSSLKMVLLISFSNCVKYIMNHEVPQSLVISALGRFFFNIIPTQKDYLTEKELEQWLSMIELIVLKLAPVSTSVLNITAQKTLDSAFCFFPIRKEFSFLIAKQLCNISLESNISLLKEGVFNILCKIINTHLKDEEILDFITICAQTGIFSTSFTEADALIQMIINIDYDFTFSHNMIESPKQNDNNNQQKHKKRIKITEKNCKQYFFVFNHIGKNEKYNSVVKQTLINALPLIDKESQNKFIHENSTNIYLMISIWSYLCDLKSSRYNEDFYENNSFQILNSLFSKLQYPNPSVDENMILQILTFVKNVFSENISNKSNKPSKWYIYGVIPYLIPLLNDTRDPIKELSQSIFLLIHQEMGKFID